MKQKHYNLVLRLLGRSVPHSYLWLIEIYRGRAIRPLTYHLFGTHREAINECLVLLRKEEKNLISVNYQPVHILMALPSQSMIKSASEIILNTFSDLTLTTTNYSECDFKKLDYLEKK